MMLHYNAVSFKQAVVRWKEPSRSDAAFCTCESQGTTLELAVLCQRALEPSGDDIAVLVHGEIRSKPPATLPRAAMLTPVTSVYRKAKCCPESSAWSLNVFHPYLEILLAYVI